MVQSGPGTKSIRSFTIITSGFEFSVHTAFADVQNVCGLTANICPFLLAERNQFHASRSGPLQAQQKCHVVR